MTGREQIIFDKQYSPEEIADISGDLDYMFETLNLPKNSYGFHRGLFNIKVEFIPDD